MASRSQKADIVELAVQLTPSVRRAAEAFSAQEGISLNQFINIALTEKLAQLKHVQGPERKGPAGAGKPGGAPVRSS